MPNPDERSAKALESAAKSMQELVKVLKTYNPRPLQEVQGKFEAYLGDQTSLTEKIEAAIIDFKEEQIPFFGPDGEMLGFGTVISSPEGITFIAEVTSDSQKKIFGEILNELSISVEQNKKENN